MAPKEKALIIYNLFPRHFHSIDEWTAELPRIADMGFNAIFVNPFFETGSSGSLYAIKDYFRLNPLFLAKGQDAGDFKPIERFNDACNTHGMDLYIDLVINHTAFDSVLTASHPQWYKHDAHGNLLHPSAIDPGDGSKVTVWGDLATIDNEESADRDGLWRYWDQLIVFFQTRGIHGFRCDAAYQVSSVLWKTLITAAKKRGPAIFLAETLGCRLDQIEALSSAGFDYLFNSVKWWNYDQPWAIDQHATNKTIAPSIAFPESHDTERLATEKPGTIAVQKSRYAFASIFSKGLLIPMGYEYGAVKRMDVVRGTPNDVEWPPRWNMSEWIRTINQLKLSIPVLSEEGSWSAMTPYNRDYLFLMKRSDAGNSSLYVCVNKRNNSETVVEEWMIPDAIKKCSCAMSLLSDVPQEESVPIAFTLDPADVVLFYE
jgi:starch synthase (maltosyl-transferring)